MQTVNFVEGIFSHSRYQAPKWETKRFVWMEVDAMVVGLGLCSGVISGSPYWNAFLRDSGICYGVRGVTSWYISFVLFQCRMKLLVTTSPSSDYTNVSHDFMHIRKVS